MVGNFIPAGNITSLDLQDVERLEEFGVQFGAHPRADHATCDIVESGLNWSVAHAGDGITSRVIWVCLFDNIRLFWASKFEGQDAAFDVKYNARP